MSKILYAASTISHIRAFHMPYIEALRAEGHEVLTLARGEGADYDIPFEKKLFSRGNTACRREIKKIVGEGNFDLIILNTSLAAFHIRMALGRVRPRVINIAHGYLFPKRAAGSLKAKIKRLLLLTAERAVSGKTDAVITMNSEDTEIARKYKLSRGQILECSGMGVPLPPVREGAEDIRARYAGKGEFVLLFVGEYSGRKNQKYLISLLPKIKERIGSVKLWLVGEGDKRPELEELIGDMGLSEDVLLLGRRENPVDYMRAADVYVSASESEGLPFNTVEALGAGCDTIASDVKGHSDILSGGAGVLFPLSEPESLVGAICSLRSGQISISAEEKRRAYEKYSFDCVFADTLSKIKSAGGLN